MALKHKLGENLKRIRKSKGYTQAELAAQIFVTTQAISKWERGESEPGIDHIQDLTSILNVSADALLGILPNAAPALLAVDGGGTKTEFVLISPDGNLLHRLVLSGSNPNSVSREGSFRILCQGIDRMLQLDYSILSIFIGCAGMAAGGNGEAITDSLRKQYPGIKLCCSSDICNIIACAKDSDNAIAVICGTGSVVYSTSQGKMIRTGGGGWLIDPIGSGFGIGRAALLAALEHKDGTGQATSLTKAVEQKLGGTVWDNIRGICDSDPNSVAAFAPMVVECWQSGDPVATHIIEEHTDRLAQLIRCAKKKSPMAEDLILGGSLLTKCVPFRKLLISKLPKGVKPQTTQYPPIWGACLQSAKLCGMEKPNYDTFKVQYEGMA